VVDLAAALVAVSVDKVVEVEAVDIPHLAPHLPAMVLLLKVTVLLLHHKAMVLHHSNRLE